MAAPVRMPSLGEILDKRLALVLREVEAVGNSTETKNITAGGTIPAAVIAIISIAGVLAVIAVILLAYNARKLRF